MLIVQHLYYSSKKKTKIAFHCPVLKLFKLWSFKGKQASMQLTKKIQLQFPVIPIGKLYAILPGIF